MIAISVGQISCPYLRKLWFEIRKDFGSQATDFSQWWLTTDSYFSDTNIPPVKDYSTYRGQKSTDAKNITYSGEKITHIGDEGKFTYPHSDFIEYVVYVKNSDSTPQPEPVKDSRTVTETIHYVYQDGTKAANDETQQITFTRTGSKTSKSTTWNDWIPAEGTFNEVVSPEIKDYTPNIKTVNEIKIAPEDNNIEKTVIYTKNSTPTPGTKPTPTPQPEPKPTPTPEPQPTSTPTPAPQPEPQPTPTPQPTSTPTPAPQPVPASEPQPQLTPKSAPQPGISNPSSKSEGLVEPQAESQLVQNESRQLPQTGSEQAKGLMALGIASLLTSFGLGMKKKKNI